MKNTTFVFTAIAVLILGVGGYLVVTTNKDVAESGLKDGFERYSQAEVGLEFDYRTGPSGYVVEERMPVDLGEQPIKTIILFRTEDTMSPRPIGGEGPAVITISVFNNTLKQSLRVWADENNAYSSVNLKTGEITDTVVGGANAIRYMADGLYASENIVVMHGEYVYVIVGQFLDQGSELRRDFAPLVDSIRFIPKADGFMGMRVGKNALNINEQKVGTAATVSFVVLEKSGYVVVHETTNGKPGRIIGASTLLRAGQSDSVPVTLSTGLKDGMSYIAMLHADNGDGVFDAATDLPVTNDDVDGAIIMMEFQASVNASPVKPVSI